MDLLPLMPVRRLHNYCYCKRLFFLQWVEDLWIENADTAAGSHLHRNTDKPSHWKGDLKFAGGAPLRSISLQSSSLGIIGTIDLIEDTSNGREIIDYKKGSAKRDSDGMRIAKDNDALQIAAYVLLLEEAGQKVDRASIYYEAERSRIPVDLSNSLFLKCRKTIQEARDLALKNECPPPLQSDSRCLHCSAYSICLPNESSYWSGILSNPPKDREPPRPPKDEGEILVIQNNKAYVGLKGGEIHIRLGGKTVSKHPIEQIQSVYLYGGIQTSTQALHALIEKEISVAYFSPAGRFIGMTQGLPQSGVDARLGQAKIFTNPKIRTKLARSMIRAKIHNQRVLLMRNGKLPDVELHRMAKLRDACYKAEDLDRLRGLEGSAAAIYFEYFGTMLKGAAFENFDFQGRNRRPPKDPVNALLSQGYSILAKELTGMCHAVGLDPFIGVFHQPRYGRPALALDLMEEFRPLVADSVTVSLLNRQELDLGDFITTSKGTFMNENGRRQFWRAWFRRLDSEVKHPQFGYRMSYRRMLDVQVRQLWRFCRGDSSEYHPFTTR